MTAKKMILSTYLVFTLLNACAPAPTSTPEPGNSNAAAIAVVDQFYTQINDAQSKNDFLKPWALLSNDMQCSPTNRCDLSYFQDRWWPSKVIYKIYDCGPNGVVAEENLYPRESDPSSAHLGLNYFSYEFIGYEEHLVINARKTVQKPGGECKLVVGN